MPITPLLGKLRLIALLEPATRMAASSSIQGECPTIATIASDGCSPTWFWSSTRSGSSASGSHGTGGEVTRATSTRMSAV